MRLFPIAGIATGLACTLLTFAALADTPSPSPEPAPVQVPRAEFPADWRYHGDNADRVATLKRTDGRPAPDLKTGAWLVGEPLTMASMRGRIVVLDFWGTWCGPCLKALPHTNDLAQKYKDRGVEFIALCDATTGADRAPAVVQQLGLTFPVAMDQGKATYNAYLGQWYPFYVIVDRHGVIRVSGLRPDTIEPALERLLVEQPVGSVPMAAPSNAVPAGPSAAWSEGTPAQRAGLADIEGKGAAPLKVVESSWVNSDPTDLAALRGKVVLLDFWGTWCGPCLQTVPKINALHEKYGKDGLVVIGVCHSRNSATMPEVAQKHGIAYPIVADTAGATFKAYRVNGTPDYFLIDRAGTIRFADIANAHIEDAIRFLLAEPAPAAAPN